MSPDTRFRLALFAAVVAAVVLHELGHALTALAFGDDTAKRAGRITLNPWKVNPFGAVILPGLLVLARAYPVAFAATPVNPARMRNPRRQAMWCSLAGPAVNLALIGASILVLRHASVLRLDGEVGRWPSLYLAAYVVGYINVILAVFNLVPIPPLDGSAVVEHFLPREWWPGWVKFRQWGIGILLILVLGTHVLDTVLRPCLNLWARGWAHTRLF